MISKKHNCIFIHIPKSGGSSIENMIWPVEERTEEQLWMGLVSPFRNKYQTGGLQHLKAAQVEQETGKEFYEQAVKFTFVRNPWDKIISQYISMKTRYKLRCFIGMNKNDSLMTYLELIKQTKHIQWEEQHKFFMDENETVLVDHVLRFEDFEAEAKRILNIIGVEYSAILHSNRGCRTEYQDYYNNETRAIVADMFSRDIELLDYAY